MLETMLDGLKDYPAIKYIVMTMMPSIESRGAVLMAFGFKETRYIPLIMIVNALACIPIYFFLEYFYDHIVKVPWLHKKLEHAREKTRPSVERYGFWGLALIGSIPFPGTGPYTIILAAWLLDVPWQKGFLAVVIGIIVSTVILSGASAGVISIF